jgi:hypothetical protein
MTRKDVDKRNDKKPYRISVPGFLHDDELGLGDVLKKVTYTLGIKPCGGCDRRATALNNWLVFSGRE